MAKIILVALLAFLVTTMADAGPATERLCAGQPCSLPTCPALAASLGWTRTNDGFRGIRMLHRAGRCRMDCGPYPCVPGR